MNCLFICIFYQEKYVEMFYLLLESITKYAELPDNCEILLYTSTPFMELIKQHSLFSDKIKFEINNSYNNVSSACKSRLDWFSLSSSFKYANVLYLDTDIIINGPISPVFSICKEDLLYVLEEGLLTWPDDYYGGISLFGDEIYKYSDISAFTSGILLFKSCVKIKWLFNKISEDIINRPFNLGCHDQPYIICSAFKYAAYNNKLMKQFAINNDISINSGKIIHHFPGGPGVYSHKIAIMTYFLRQKTRYEMFMIKNKLYPDPKSEIDDNITTQVVGSWSYKFKHDLLHFFKDKREIRYEFFPLSTLLLTENIIVDRICLSTNYDDIITTPKEAEYKEASLLLILEKFKYLSYIIIAPNNHSLNKEIQSLIDTDRLQLCKVLGENEGSIYKIINFNLINKIYSWENSYIKFLDDSRMVAFGLGTYIFLSRYTIYAEFGGQEHIITFNVCDGEEEYSSIRKADAQEITGHLIRWW